MNKKQVVIKNIDNLGEVVVLKNHNYSKSGIVGNLDGFHINGRKYGLEPGYIQRKNGEVELLELSFVEKDNKQSYKSIKKEKNKFKRMYGVQKEMREHFEDLFKTASQEHQHQGIQRQDNEKLLNEADELLEQGVKSSLVRAYIKNGREKIVLNDSIHYDKVCGIDKNSFGAFVEIEDEELEEFPDFIARISREVLGKRV